MAAKKAGMATGVEVARISVKVSPNTKMFRSELLEKLRIIEKSVKGNVEVTASLNSAQARADFQRMKSQMERNGRIKVGVDYVADGKGPDGKGGGRNKTGIFGLFGGGGGGGFNMSKLIPSFGTGINPAGYLAILTAAVLVAAPLIGLLSTAILAIPGLISAVATPFMAISLGLEGIKKAAGSSGLFKYDEEGKLEGLGAVFDNVKAQVSKAFDEGLTPAFKALAASIDPLLGSLPKVATGLSDMFQGFVDSLTSAEGMRLFDDTIKNIGAAMSQAAPGVKSFTDGMLGIANSFSQQLPGLSNWFNKTGDDFAKWVQEMTAPIEGPGIDGKSKMDLAFAGLGDTLRTIADWVVDMGAAGLKFVQDPKKMDDFVASLENLGRALSNLVDIGNKLGPAWEFLSGNAKPDGQNQTKIEAEKALEVPKPEENIPAPPPPPESLFKRIGDWLTEDGPGTKLFNDLFPKSPDELKSDIQGLKSEIVKVEEELRDKMENGGLTPPAGRNGIRPKPDAILNNYKDRLANMRAELAELQAMQAELSPDVALKSFETPLSPAEGGKPSFVNQLLTDLKGVPAAAAPAKDALQQVKETGALTPEALGQVSDQAQQQQKVDIPAPDTSAFDSALQQLPAATDQAMQAVTASITSGGANASAAALIVAQNIYSAMVANAAQFQTVGLQMMAGLAAGINAGSSMAIQAAINAATSALNAAKDALEIKSPSKKFAEIGDYSMQGMAVGMENGIGPVIDQAKDMADKVALAFSEGLDPTMALKGFSKQEINRMEKVLKVQSSDLGRKVKALNYRGLKDEAEKARMLKDEIDSRREILDLANEYNGTTSSGSSSEDPFAKAAAGLMSAPVDFAKATGQQFLSDLGIGGDGLIGKAITEGISYVFNIGSVDEALSIKDREDSKAAQSAIGR